MESGVQGAEALLLLILPPSSSLCPSFCCSDAGPGWHCQEVVVFDMTENNKRYAFPCDR